MGVVAGLLLGAGLCLVWFSFFEPEPERPDRTRWTDQIGRAHV